MSRAMLLIFEGFDKVGKTSLINAIDKATNYKHFMLDRGPASYIAYGNLLHKEHAQRDYVKLEMMFKENLTLQICLTADIQDIEDRFRVHGEGSLPMNTNIEDHKIEFEAQYTLSNMPHKIIINTSPITIEETLKIVLDKIEEISNAAE